MFIDEKTQSEIFADLNASVSHGTLNTAHLVNTFLGVIRGTVEYEQFSMDSANNQDLKVIFDPTASDDDERWENEYLQYFLNEVLFDILNSYSPDGYYFGSTEGDGSDFGYWQNVCE